VGNATRKTTELDAAVAGITSFRDSVTLTATAGALGAGAWQLRLQTALLIFFP